MLTYFQSHLPLIITLAIPLGFFTLLFCAAIFERRRGVRAGAADSLSRWCP